MRKVFVNKERIILGSNAVRGGCHCGSVRYEIKGEHVLPTLRHRHERRRSSPASPDTWVAVRIAEFQVIKGSPNSYPSSATAVHHFCPTCGAGLFSINDDLLPGFVHVKAATLDRREVCASHLHSYSAKAIGCLRSALHSSARAANPER